VDAAGLLREWNDVRNTPKDLQVLANSLLVLYKNRVWNTHEQLPAR